MNRVSCSFLRIRRFHGVLASLVAAIAMLALLVTARADGTVSDSTSLGLEDKLKETSGLITFATNGNYQLTNWVVRTNTMIDGSGYNVTITANSHSRIFTISTNVTLTLTNVTLSGGKTNQGAAIYNNGGILVCSNVTFVGNSATNASGANGTAGSGGHIAGGTGANGGASYGGAIYNNQGPMTLIFCTFTNNTASAGNGGNGGNGYNGLGGDGGDAGAGGPASGGAIFNNGVNAVTTIGGCFFVTNTALAGSGGIGGSPGSGGSIPGNTGSGGSGSIGLGGAIYNSAGATLTITNSSFVNNYSAGGNTMAQGFTFSGSSANGQPGGSAYGGALDSLGALNLTNCTIYLNGCVGGRGGDVVHDTAATAGSGGNAGGAAVASAGIFFAKNCTIATNDAVAGTNGVNQVNSAKNGSRGLTQGGNLYRGGTTSKSTIFNTILQHGIGVDNYGAISNGGFNISSDTSCAFLSTSTSLSSTNASLTNVLVFFTNQTLTCAPVLPINPGSVAEDFITNYVGPAIDERDSPRYLAGYPDAGAFEIDPTAPIITVQPNDLALTNTGHATFSVVAVGTKPLAYQWWFQHDSNSLAVAFDPPRGTNSTLTVTNRGDGDLGTYFVIVSNPVGITNSRNATLTLASPLTNLTVVTDPVSLLKLGAGSDVDFEASVDGPAPIFQWSFNGKPLVDTDDVNQTNGVVTGSDSSELHISSITTSNTGTYTLVVSNSISKLSTNILLTVVDPGIVDQPQSQTVNEGATVTFFGSATSTIDTNFSYGWKVVQGGKTNTAPNFTNGPAYTIPSVALTDAGTYFMVVTNSKGTATSTPATLTVNSANSTIQGHVFMGTNPVTNAVIFLGGGRMITGSDGLFSRGHLGNSTNTLVPDQSVMTILPTNLVVVLDGTNSRTDIVFQAFPTINAGVSTNGNLPLTIGGGANQTLKVQYSSLLTSNSWLDLTNVVTTPTNTATLVLSNISAAPYLFFRVTTP